MVNRKKLECTNTWNDYIICYILLHLIYRNMFNMINTIIVDVYKQGRKNILEAQKPFKKVLTSPHTPGWMTIPSTLTVHAWLIREIYMLGKLWNPGTQQLRTMLTIMRNDYQDNIQFYFEPHISIFTRTQAFPLFLLQFLFFHTFYCIYFNVHTFYLLLVKDYRLCLMFWLCTKHNCCLWLTEVLANSCIVYLCKTNNVYGPINAGIFVCSFYVYQDA